MVTGSDPLSGEVTYPAEPTEAERLAAQAAKAERKAAKRERKRIARRRRLRRLAIVWIVVALISALLYALVVATYRDSTVPPDRPTVTKQDSITVYAQPTKVNPADGIANMDISLAAPFALTGADSQLDDKLDLLLFSATGTKIMTFPRGTPSLALNDETTVRFDGDPYAAYPLDQYNSGVGVLAKVDAPTGAVWYPVELALWGDVPGWRIASDSQSSFTDSPVPINDSPTDASESVPADSAAFVGLSVKRAGSTIAIVALLSVALIAVAVLAVVIAYAVSRRVRRPEATLAGWFAALLFAVIPLRLNMPGAPPIGVWIDFLMFMWVVLALMLALTVFVLTSLRFSPRPELQGRKRKAKGRARSWHKRHRP